MTRTIGRFAWLLLLTGGVVLGQGSGPDQTSAVSDSTNVTTSDTAASDDNRPPSLAETIDDSIRIAFPHIDPDTLTENQRLLAEHETRLVLRMQEVQAREIPNEISYFDSLTGYYLSLRWDLREDIARSFYHDAGDYLKSDPSFLVLEPQTTPIRKTAQPYGLTGNRLGLLIEGQPLEPFEHVLEPDGMIDLNDAPTALDYTVAALPGPVGMVFGAESSVATLMTLPKPTEDTNPESSFLVDKGTFAYSHARGKYRKKFRDGRRVDMSLEYRSSDGLSFGREDDAYHYTGNVLWPLDARRAVRFQGRLYDRRGPYLVRPELGGGGVNRDRFDRSFELLYLSHNEAQTHKYELGYSHRRQASYTNGVYRATLDFTGHGLHLAREWSGWGMMVRASAVADWVKFDNWHEEFTRTSGGARLSLATRTRPTGLAIDLRQTYVERYRWLPSASVMLRRETEASYMMISAAYAERAPTLLELYLPYQSATLYAPGSLVDDYADGGYPNLVSEKMLNGAAEISLGQKARSITVTASGGHIVDGIDWLQRTEGTLEVFTPVNGDIDFANVTGTARLELADFLRLRGGGSYHYLDYETVSDPPYAPEYQAFSGLELHLYWKQKLIDFWAYGEVVYTGPYHGLVRNVVVDDPELLSTDPVVSGDEAIFNAKVSFRMGHFRFHFVSQNALSLLHYARDGWQKPGRYTTYGFTWDFID